MYVLFQGQEHVCALKFGHSHQSRSTNRGVSQLTNCIPKVRSKNFWNTPQCLRNLQQSISCPWSTDWFVRTNRRWCDGDWNFNGEWLFRSYSRTLFRQIFLIRGPKFLLCAHLAMRTLQLFYISKSSGLPSNSGNTKQKVMKFVKYFSPDLS
jgi:hypothetical protein